RTPHVYSYEKDGSTLYYVTFYCKQWDGTNKKIKKMGFTRQADAARYEQEYRDRLAGSPAMTFAALCDRFLDDCKHHVRESTYMTRAGILTLPMRKRRGSVKTEIKALTKRECFLHAFFRPGAARRLKRTGVEVA
uniref:hypothetical protein n=1 Tax=Mitsuokella multacida TaxID=52226 RepID=UPI003FA33256